MMRWLWIMATIRFCLKKSLEAVLDVSRVLATFEISKLLSKTRFSNGGAENNCQKKKELTVRNAAGLCSSAQNNNGVSSIME